MLIKTPKKHILLILLIIILLIALIFYPDISQALSIAILTFSIGIAIIFTIHRNWEAKKSNELTNSQFARNTFFDLLGLALTMGAAIWLGHFDKLSVNSAGGYAGQAVGMEAGQTWGITSTALSARIAGIVAGMGAGFSGALLVGRVWGRVSLPLRV